MSYLLPLFQRLNAVGSGHYVYDKVMIESIINRRLPDYLLQYRVAWYSKWIKKLKWQYNVYVADVSYNRQFIVFKVY